MVAKSAAVQAAEDAQSIAEEAELTPAQLEEVIVDEIAGVLWRIVYLRREDLTEEHVLEFAK